MTKSFEVKLPKLGESITSATVVRWLKQEGDKIAIDEPLLEVSTDKVNSEIPSPVSGTLKTITAKDEQTVDVGELLCTIATTDHVSASDAPKQTAVNHKTPACGGGERSSFYSPAVLRLSREQGVSLSELEKITPTGKGGRLSKRDLENYIRGKSSRPSLAPQSGSPAASKIEKVKMSGMRKSIAENMVRSFYQAPHASLIAEVDVTNVLRTIKKEKAAFLEKWGVKLTITTFIARAIARAVKEFPLLNSTLENDTIVIKHFVNLGIAVSIEQGVIVPVIQNAQDRPLHEIAKFVASFADKARSGKLDPSDVKEGTITMTNFGMSGVSIGIPIIRYPEVAIVGIGAIQKKVMPLDDDAFAIRSMMHISLTFDHRVLDGMYGCGFLGALKRHLEEDISL